MQNSQNGSLLECNGVNVCSEDFYIRTDSMDIKKRKRGDVDEEGISERKKKVSGFAEEKQNINKPIELVRTVKSLLQKEQTRLAGMLKWQQK